MQALKMESTSDLVMVDMGQIHQHLVPFNHIAIGHSEEFLEYIPHLKSHFVHPVDLRDGRYQTPPEAGSSTDLL